MRIFLILILLILSGCETTVKIDYTKEVVACTDIHDSKDDLIYYKENMSSFESMTTGVDQFTYVDVYGKRRMLNEYEIENYKCQVITSEEQFKKIVND